MEKGIAGLSENDVAAIKGCILNGASVLEIYQAFDGTYSVWQIKQVLELIS